MKYILSRESFNSRVFENNFNIDSYTNFDLSIDDLRDIAKWGLEYDYSYSGAWDECGDDIECAINATLQDFEKMLSIPYPKELGNVPTELKIYRLVRLQNIDEYDPNRGLSWFSDIELVDNSNFTQILDHLKKDNDPDYPGRIFVIAGKTHISNVDVPNTLWQRSTQWYENEIVVRDPSKVRTLHIVPKKEYKTLLKF